LLPETVKLSEFASVDGPIDLVHLSQQTLGDLALEQELLGLFERQTRKIVATLELAADDPVSGRHADLAHLICGSSRAIGAFRLAAAAQAYERAAQSRPGQSATESARVALCEAAHEACAAVAGLIGEGQERSADTDTRLSPKL
jgi:HPt (histidine-containing phosphotransfer) domain-containing protein